MAAPGLAGLRGGCRSSRGEKSTPRDSIFRRRPATPGAGRLIAAGGPYPYAQDDTIFGNYGATLPHEPRGYYREFTVRTPGASTRGTLRVVTGSGGEDYYTADHYDSFDWIACAHR